MQSSVRWRFSHQVIIIRCDYIFTFQPIQTHTHTKRSLQHSKGNEMQNLTIHRFDCMLNLMSVCVFFLHFLVSFSPRPNRYVIRIVQRSEPFKLNEFPLIHRYSSLSFVDVYNFPFVFCFSSSLHLALFRMGRRLRFRKCRPTGLMASMSARRNFG